MLPRKMSPEAQRNVDPTVGCRGTNACRSLLASENEKSKAIPSFDSKQTLASQLSIARASRATASWMTKKI